MKSAPVWLLVCVLALPCLAEDAPRLVKIAKVLHDKQPQKRESLLQREIGPNEVGKFKELREDLQPKPDGEYFTIIWKTLAREPLKNVTVTLYFRQARRAETQSDKIELAEVKRGTTTSKFRVIGEAHAKGGPITAWRADVMADGKTLDSFRSFLWKDPS